jgi:hypothetical protein
VVVAAGLMLEVVVGGAGQEGGREAEGKEWVKEGGGRGRR